MTSTAEEQQSVASVPTPAVEAPAWWILLGVFLVLTFVMTFRSLGRFDTHVVGDSGDPLLILWILGWVQHAIPHGWDAIWNTSMFFPTRNTLAFSDSMLSVAIVEWPLRAVFGAALSLNVVTLAAQTASLWFTYRVALLLTRSWMASVVGALAFAFSTPMLSHLGHYQLTITAFLVPLTLLLLLRYLDSFRLRYGIGIGLAFAALTTSATYYGLMMAVGVAVVFVGYLCWFRPRPVWPCVRGIAAGALVAAVITVPVAIQYTKLQDDPYFRRDFNSVVAAHPGDFLSPTDDNYVLTDVPVLEQHAFDRTIENRLFPGFVALAFGAVGFVVVVRGLRRRGAADDEAPAGDEEPLDDTPASDDDHWCYRMTILIVIAGVVSVVLAFGDEIFLFGHRVPLLFGVLRDHVPGFSGIRATSRFVLLGQCALAVCAAFGVRALLGRLRRRAAIATLLVLCALIVAETARAVPLVRVPAGKTAEAVDDFLDRRPPGVTVELPVHGPAYGSLWPYLEAPRQFLSLADANERLNGYSGYAPENFDTVAAIADEFPDARAMKLLDEHGVRYVVLRTQVLGEQNRATAKVLRRDGVGRYTRSTAESMIAQIPPERVRQVTRLPGGYVVELRRPTR